MLDADENSVRTQGRTVLAFWVTSLQKEFSVDYGLFTTSCVHKRSLLSCLNDSGVIRVFMPPSEMIGMCRLYFQRLSGILAVNEPHFGGKARRARVNMIFGSTLCTVPFVTFNL